MLMPMIEISVRNPKFARMVFQSRRRYGQANGRKIAKAPIQRTHEIVAGGICPAMKRPSTTFPAQKSDTSVSKSRGLSNRKVPERRARGDMNCSRGRKTPPF